MVKFPFRILLTSWGISIDLDITLAALKCPPLDAERIEDGVFLVLPEPLPLPIEDVDFIRSGVRRMASAARDYAGVSAGSSAVIEISNLDYVPTDYQAEGLEAAVVASLSELIGIDPPEVRVTFDSAANRYQFSYEEELESDR